MAEEAAHFTLKYLYFNAYIYINNFWRTALTCPATYALVETNAKKYAPHSHPLHRQRNPCRNGAVALRGLRYCIFVSGGIRFRGPRIQHSLGPLCPPDPSIGGIQVRGPQPCRLPDPRHPRRPLCGRRRHSHRPCPARGSENPAAQVPPCSAPASGMALRRPRSSRMGRRGDVSYPPSRVRVPHRYSDQQPHAPLFKVKSAEHSRHTHARMLLCLCTQPLEKPLRAVDLYRRGHAAHCFACCRPLSRFALK